MELMSKPVNSGRHSKRKTDFLISVSRLAILCPPPLANCFCKNIYLILLNAIIAHLFLSYAPIYLTVKESDLMELINKSKQNRVSNNWYNDHLLLSGTVIGK